MSMQGPGGFIPNDAGMQQRLTREFDQKLNQVAGGLRRQSQQEMQKVQQSVQQSISELAAIARAVNTGGSASPPGTVRIEDIPGRRIPYDMLVDINIGQDVTTERTGTFTVTQEGPFVATKRVIAFQSALEFQYTNATTGDVSNFSGRSYGRYRPPHSACDVNDSQHNAKSDTSYWFFSWIAALAAGEAIPPGVLALPSSASSFRTMEFDGRVEVESTGDGFRRQRIKVPTTMWTTDIVSPQDLGALDFFERGTAVTIKVEPTHVHNPPVGNVTGTNVFSDPNADPVGFPFAEGQYDPHEGIATPGAITDGAEVVTLESDVITRLPSGILTIGYIGYRIVQGPGAQV